MRICRASVGSMGICENLKDFYGFERFCETDPGRPGPGKVHSERVISQGKIGLQTRCRLAAEMARVPGRGISNSCRAVLSGGEKLGRRTW